MTSSQRFATVVTVLASSVALAGCSGQGSAEDDSVRAIAERFTSSIAADPGESCALLAPRTAKSFQDQEVDCTTALPDLVHAEDDGPISVQVYGKDAIVHIGASTLFLARFTDGWRVTATGCTPVPDRPYDCAVEGN